MRFLADAGVSPSVVTGLRAAGHDAVHVRDLQMQRAVDRAILDAARNEARVLLTFDLDFGDLMAQGVFDSPSVILFRLSDERPDTVSRRLAAVLDEASDALAEGALVVAEDSRFRVRRLPIGRR